MVAWVFSLIPRRIIVRATHRAVKWRNGATPVGLDPGIWWYWPFLSEVETIVVARQTHNQPPPELITRDDKQVVVCPVVVYSSDGVVKAIGKRNWDVESTVSDITASTIIGTITTMIFDDLRDNISGHVVERLTRACRKKLRQFGVWVHQCSVTDFSLCRTYNVLGGQPMKAINSSGS